MVDLVLTGTGTASGLRVRAALNMVATKATAVVRALRARHAVRGLCQYDERMLKDIGLTYSDVSAALDCPLGQDPSRHLSQVAAGRCRAAR